MKIKKKTKKSKNKKLQPEIRITIIKIRLQIFQGVGKVEEEWYDVTDVFCYMITMLVFS